MEARSRRWRSVLSKAALALVSIAVGLLLAEGVFRLLQREEIELHGLYTQAPVVGVGLSPGFRGSMRTSEYEYAVVINDLGMRDDPVEDKEAGVTRILVLGDSFVFGVGVELEDSLPKALERHLNEPAVSGRAVVEALNAGVPGYSPFQELHNLRRLAPEVEADLVVLVFFVGDDWFGNAPRVPPQEARRSLRQKLSIHSSLFRAFDRFVLARLKGRDQYAIHLLEPAADFLARREAVLALLNEARASAQAHGADFLVVLCPRYTQVYDSAWRKASLVYRLDSEAYSPLEPNRRFGGLLAAGGFWYVDLLEPLREQVRQQHLHFPVDGHWNRQGNDFVASILAATIRPRLQTSSSPSPQTEAAP